MEEIGFCGSVFPTTGQVALAEGFTKGFGHGGLEAAQLTNEA